MDNAKSWAMSGFINLKQCSEWNKLVNECLRTKAKKTLTLKSKMDSPPTRLFLFFLRVKAVPVLCHPEKHDFKSIWPHQISWVVCVVERIGDEWASESARASITCHLQMTSENSTKLNPNRFSKLTEKANNQVSRMLGCLICKSQKNE